MYHVLVHQKLHRNIRLLSYFNFFVNFEPHNPIAIIYFSQVSGSFALGMTVFSIGMISSSILEIPTGVYSDMVGRKKTMLTGGIVGTLSIIFFALADSFLLLAIGAVFEGMMAALYSGNNNAFLYDTLKQKKEEEEYAHFLGRTSSMFQMGLGTSALLGAAIAYFFGMKAVFFVGIIPRCMCVLVGLCMTEPRVHDRQIDTNIFAHMRDALVQFKKNVKLRMLSSAQILDFGFGQAAHNFAPAFFSLYWPVWSMGLARVIANSTAFVSFWFAGKWIKKFKPLPVLMGVKGGSHIITFIAYGIPSVLSPLILSMLSLGYGVKTVAENTLLQKEFTDEQRATMASLNQLAGSILYAMGAFSLGFVADTIGPRNTLIAVECVLALGLLLYWKVFHHEKNVNSQKIYG